MLGRRKSEEAENGGATYSFDKVNMERFGPHEQAWFWITEDRDKNPIYWRLESGRVFRADEFGTLSGAENEIDNYATQYLGEKPNWVKQPYGGARALEKQLGGLGLWSNSKNLALTGNGFMGVFKKFSPGMMKTYLLRGVQKPPDIELEEVLASMGKRKESKSDKVGEDGQVINFGPSV